MSDPLLPSGPSAELPTRRLVGITTTVPIEVIYASGRTPVDLNNLFITSPDPSGLAGRAGRAGFPRTSCCWTKGLYGAVHQFGIETVLAVTRGDCSNAEALLEVLRGEGVRCLSFDYPRRQDAEAMAGAIGELTEALGARLPEAESWRRRLKPARDLARQIDRLTWRDGKVRGLENHLWLVSTSDFCADPDCYRSEAETFVQTARARDPVPHRLRIGLCGVPPIVPGLYDFLESLGGLVVYNETQRQFAMPEPAESLAEQYARYTYPYGLGPRLADIRAECDRRSLDGLIHYVQSFCHRRIEDRIIRERVEVPVLTLEADRPGPLGGQLKTRLEAFAEMLSARRCGGSP